MWAPKRLFKFCTHGLLALCLSGGLSACAMHVVSSGRVATPTAQTGHAAASFSERDRQLLRQYYRQHPPAVSSVPRAVRQERVSADIAARSLPSALEVQLSPLPTGYGRVLVGRDAVIIERATRTVVDIAYSVVP